MNVAKNMEAIFVATAVLLGVTSYAAAALPAHYAGHPAVVAPAPAADAAAMPVIVVSAKRLSAAQKAALAG